MTISLQHVLRGEVPSGVYEIRSRLRPATIRRKVEERGWRFFYLDGHTICDKATLLDSAARTMDFPTTFGRNWDALFDSMTDLSWASAPGYVLLYDHVVSFAETAPDEWAAAYDILTDAADRWHQIAVPFYVLLR